MNMERFGTKTERLKHQPFHIES